MKDINSNKVFIFLKGLYTFVISGASILFILACGFILVAIFMDKTRERHVTNVVNVGDQIKSKDVFVFGHPNTIDGTSYIRIPLYRDQSYDMSYYSKSSSGNEVNYLFMNGENGRSEWLMQSTNYLFVSDVILFDKLKQINNESRKAVGIIYALIEKDTNGDNRLSEKDAITIGFSALDGSGYTKLIENVDRLYALNQISDNRTVVLYQKNGEEMSEIYEIPSMKKLSEFPIPKVDLE